MPKARTRAATFGLRHSALWCAALALATCVAVPTPASAIEVEQALWGFDGQAVAGRFNPLSVEFSNPTGEPFDGAVVLRRFSGGFGGRSGAEIVQPVYVGPFERSRWVQFYAYVPNQWETWTLHWPGRAQELPVPISRQRDEPVRVLLADSDPTTRRGGAMKHFPDHLFPPMVTATETLEGAVLGHVPRWQEPRQRAFGEWLHAGGILHLLTDGAGRVLEFPPALADLNNPAERFTVGRGMVYRHARSRGQLDSQYVRTAILPVRNPALGQVDVPAAEPGGADAALEAAAEELESREMDAYMVQEFDRVYLGEGFGDTAFAHLKEMTRPDHNWGLIYLLALVYIGCIFPGCYVLGRKRIDYRLVYAALLAAVMLFSFAFAFVGRRGYGETTAVNTVAIARALPDGNWDVTGWSNAFVTSGDTYRITHQGSGVLYSTAQSDEAVPGRIVNGPGAAFDVDIPAFSSRTFVFRTKVNLPEASARVVEWAPTGDRRRIVLAAGGPLVAGAAELPAFAIYGNTFHTVERSGDELVVRTNRGSPLAAHVESLLEQPIHQAIWYDDSGERQTPEYRYQVLQTPLVVRSIGLSRRDDLKTYSLPADRVRLFVVAPLPDELLIEDPGLGGQTGQVVFTLDVFRPDVEAGENVE